MYHDVRAIVYGSSTFARVAALQLLAAQGIEVVASTAEVAPLAREPDVIVVAAESERDIEYLHEAVPTAASGTVRIAVIGEGRGELAARAVAAGAAIVVDHESAHRLVDLVAAASTGLVTVPKQVIDQLTSRNVGTPEISDVELRWLDRLDEDKTVAQLAQEGDVTERSVHRRLNELYTRLGVNSCREALELVRRERRL